jgi:glutaredoxin
VSPLLALACAFLLTTPAWALYKVVGPDGKITYTDRPPSDQPAQSLKANGAKASTEGLPFELQRIVVKYPVTVYTSSTCSACDAGRQLLKARGIPFQEKTIITTEDIRAFAKLEGTDQLPVIRIGQKQIIGFNQSEWVSYIDAAGYPAKSLLPLNYRWPAAAPLVPPPEVTPAPEGGFARPAPRREDSPQPAGNGGAPQGFRF